jgi:hypothetical protein
MAGSKKCYSGIESTADSQPYKQSVLIFIRVLITVKCNVVFCHEARLQKPCSGLYIGYGYHTNQYRRAGLNGVKPRFLGMTGDISDHPPGRITPFRPTGDEIGSTEISAFAVISCCLPMMGLA